MSEQHREKYQEYVHQLRQCNGGYLEEQKLLRCLAKIKDRRSPEQLAIKFWKATRTLKNIIIINDQILTELDKDEKNAS